MTPRKSGQAVLFDDEGNKADMRGLSKIGITLDSVFTPSRYTCGGCGGIVWAWTTSQTDPTATSVCRVCTGEHGITLALISLDMERQRLGLGNIDSLAVRAMLHDPSPPRPHLPEISVPEEENHCASCGEQIEPCRGVAGNQWMHSETRREHCANGEGLAVPELPSRWLYHVSWLEEELDAAHGLVEYAYDERLASDWTPPCELPECAQSRDDGSRVAVLFDGVERWIHLCARHRAAWKRVVYGEEQSDEPFVAAS